MRLEMSNRTDLALKAFAHLDSFGEAGGRSIAEAIGTTANYLPQVLKPLIVEGWIRGTPGPGGGYQLCADLNSFSLLNVIEAMEGKTEENQCVLRGAPCPAPEPCALHDSWVRARDALVAELDAASVATALASAPMEGE
jgi:Rrf2 family protein